MTDEPIEPEEDHIDAAAAALQRVRLAAAEAGYRPGMAGQFHRRSKKPRPKTEDYVRSVGPQPLGDVFSKFIAQRGWKEPVAVGSVLADWASVVGPQIAENAKVETFENAKLVLRASSTAWATQLRLLTPQLMHKFDEVLGPGVITKLEIKGPTGGSYGRRPRRR
ncbi:DciA family protein [Enteractinococcus fodinae]|uniref:Nucleic acid-binding Zn ribbon protein n=1 Tax=Enteractinococcus fodinae TaxID=684663 RepID=A0ABU2AWL3_9MICC|nr:DciA family protein [Enteractinococcus fodinae]MDR7345752.1 putative nucleic acid-binding Zn ribbon protein [Enteractinococcus fodinae]